MRVWSVVGARPQFVKAAMVARAFDRERGVTHQLLHTGQHYDRNLSEVFFDELEIPRAAVNLGIGSGRHGEQTGQMLAGIEGVLAEDPPDWVVVYGDTNSTLAGALASVKLHVPVAHVEAGLRSHNRRMPEEINRVLTDHASDLLFAPTPVAMANLSREGVASARCRLVGDVMYDAACFFAERARGRSQILGNLALAPDTFVLVTVHRAENTDDPLRLKAIVGGLGEVASMGVTMAMPLHPRTREAMSRAGIGELHDGIRVIDPVGYLDMVMLEQHARLIVTDSGGIQKEAFFHHRPCVTLRDETEWTELVESGWNRLCPPVSAAAVAETISEALDRPIPGERPKLYGDGRSAERIVKAMIGD